MSVSHIPAIRDISVTVVVCVSVVNGISGSIVITSVVDGIAIDGVIGIIMVGVGMIGINGTSDVILIRVSKVIVLSLLLVVLLVM